MRSVVQHHEKPHVPWIIVLSTYNMYYPWIVRFIHGQHYPRMKRNIYLRSQSRSRQPLVRVTVVSNNRETPGQISKFPDHLRSASASKMSVRGDIVPDDGEATNPARTDQETVRPEAPPPVPLSSEVVGTDTNAPTYCPPETQRPVHAAVIFHPIVSANIGANDGSDPGSNSDTHLQALDVCVLNACQY